MEYYQFYHPIPIPDLLNIAYCIFLSSRFIYFLEQHIALYRFIPRFYRNAVCKHVFHSFNELTCVVTVDLLLYKTMSYIPFGQDKAVIKIGNASIHANTSEPVHRFQKTRSVRTHLSLRTKIICCVRIISSSHV
jgi:hypothetical protein